MPDSMRAFVLLRPGELELRTLPVPEPGAGEVVVRVRSALTCGTDVKAFTRGHPKWPMPMRFGHEFAGEIAAVGPGVDEWREGDAVMSAPTAPCRTCFFCLREQENLCTSVMETMVHGAYGEFLKLPGRIVTANLYRKPTDLPFTTAALMEPLACVLHGLEGVSVSGDDTVVLLGAGAISLLHLLALRALGAGHIIVVGRNPERARHASALGANSVLTNGMPEARVAVLEATQGRGADLVIECTGQPEVWEAGPGFARRGGHVIFFGGCPPGTEVRIDTRRFHYDEMRLRSPFHFTRRAVQRSYEMICHPSFEGAKLISGSFPLAALGDALAQHRNGAGIKFAIIPDA